MDAVRHDSRSPASWRSPWVPRSSLARNASTSFRTISRRSNSNSPKTSLGSWMRSALLPLSIQGGCYRSREPTVWSQWIAGSVSVRRASRIDPANLQVSPRVRVQSIRSRMEDFMSKVWFITGSASGLGRNIAEAVLASGDQLVATARDPRRLEDLVEKYGDRVRTASLDVADEAAAIAAVQAAVNAFGRLDVAVNNAGYGDVAPFEQLSPERFKALIDTNFYGVVYMTRAALPVMRKQRSGCILQISSVGGRLARPGSAGYHAAKWAVGGFTESIAQEVASFGV